MKFLFFLFLISLLNFKGLFNSTIPSYLLGLIQIAFFFFALMNKQLIIFKLLAIRTKILLLLFLLLYFISILRAEEFSLLIFFTYTGFSLFLLTYTSRLLLEIKENRIDQKKAFFDFFILPFVLYCGINLIFWILQIKGSSEEGETIIGQSMILSTFGIYINRVSFIFANGINSFAVVIGAIATYTLSNMFVNKEFTLKNIFYNLIIFIALLLTDSRSSLFYPLLFSLLAVVIYQTKKYKIIHLTSFFFFIAPFILIISLPFIAEIQFLQQFSRSSTDLFTLNGRIFIWFFALEEFIQFKFMHLFGYGYMGHVTSGASQKWAFMFISYKNPEVVHPHNTIISLLFDIGYFGIFILFLVFRKLAKALLSLWKTDPKNTVILFSYLFYIIFISITESFICLYYQNSINIFLSIVVFLFGIDALNASQMKKQDIL